MLADGRPNGIARSEERNDDGGTFLSFSAELGAPRPDHSLVGEVFLDGALAWRPFDLDVDGASRSVAHEDGVELEIEGVPALHGVTVRRLLAGGLVPGGKREVAVLRVGLDGRPAASRALHLARRAALPLRGAGRPRGLVVLVRPKTGVVVSLEDAAELTTG